MGEVEKERESCVHRTERGPASTVHAPHRARVTPTLDFQINTLSLSCSYLFPSPPSLDRPRTDGRSQRSTDARHMVLGGTLRPLPSEPIAGRSPLLQGRVHRGKTQARRTTFSSRVLALAGEGGTSSGSRPRPPLFHDDLGATADGGARRLTSSVLALGLSIPPVPRRHPALPETMIRGRGPAALSEQAGPRSLPLALYNAPQGFPSRRV